MLSNIERKKFILFADSESLDRYFKVGNMLKLIGINHKYSKMFDDDVEFHKNMITMDNNDNIMEGGKKGDVKSTIENMKDWDNYSFIELKRELPIGDLKLFLQNKQNKYNIPEDSVCNMYGNCEIKKLQTIHNAFRPTRQTLIQRLFYNETSEIKKLEKHMEIFCYILSCCRYILKDTNYHKIKYKYVFPTLKFIYDDKLLSEIFCKTVRYIHGNKMKNDRFIYSLAKLMNERY